MTSTPVPPPADATLTETWDNYSEHERRRYFTTTLTTITGRTGEASVRLAGEQVQTGDVLDRWVHVSAETELSPAQLRQLAAACMNAADDLERLDH